jgi:hypothetical protein
LAAGKVDGDKMRHREEAIPRRWWA